ncbi:hypothetical protein JCM5350_005344 [Sporobolomyces pararoseus]
MTDTDRLSSPELEVPPSLETILSSAQSIPRSIREITPPPLQPHQSKSSTFLSSPTTTESTKKSAETDGTGCTGSSENTGQATRSLIQSVLGRESSEEERTEEEKESSQEERGGESGSWIELEYETVEPGCERMKIESEQEKEMSLQFPEPYQPLSPSPSIIVKQEEEEEGEGNDTSFLLHEESQLFDPLSLPRVTNSQEAEGLERSVTRSQSDFTKWLEDTMRLARGDGSSVIETDDALSSILQATRQTRFGHSSTTTEENDRFTSHSSGLGAPVHLESSLSFEGELSFERDDLEMEGVKQEQEAEIVDEAKNEQQVFETAAVDSEPLSSPANPSRNYGWKLLSLSLSIALAYSLHRQRTLSQSLRPTPSTRFVPMLVDNSTSVFSPFATPVPVADTFTLPIYALAFTLLAAVPTSLALLRKGGPATEPSLSPSPLLELNGDAILSARYQLSLGIAHFNSRRIQLALATFTPILDLACAPNDKALASEWLGRCYYLLARQSGNDVDLLLQAEKALERSIRLDRTRSGPRGGLGKTKYRLGNFRGAVKAFESAVSKNDKLWWAYEWLAKSLYRFEEETSEGIVEKHLLRAIELNPRAYQAQAFLGEILHLQGKTREAFEWLERSISLRIDQPQVHARLGFIANERLDLSLAAKHFKFALETRPYSRVGGGGTSGRVDESCLVSLEALKGIAPFLSLYFVVPIQDNEERLHVLESAISEYPHDDLLQLLHSIALFKLDSSKDSKSKLETRSEQLGKRSERFPQDSPAQGLYALSLLALGEQERAQEVYSSFWNRIGGGGGRATASGAQRREGEETETREEKRRISFLVMAFFEIKQESNRVSQQTKTHKIETVSPIKIKKETKKKVTKRAEKVVVQVEREEETKPVVVAVRRSSRLSRTN